MFAHSLLVEGHEVGVTSGTQCLCKRNGEQSAVLLFAVILIHNSQSRSFSLPAAETMTEVAFRTSFIALKAAVRSLEVIYVTGLVPLFVVRTYPSQYGPD